MIWLILVILCVIHNFNLPIFVVFESKTPIHSP
jgi:hypothetical protein